MRALLYGSGYSLLETGTHALLKRAGFQVTVIVMCRHVRRCRDADRIIRVASFDELIATALSEASAGCDLIIAGDDATLVHVRNSNLTLQQKLVLLPVRSEKDFAHIGSKFGLSAVLQQAGISTPPFRVVHDRKQLRDAVAAIGVPVLLKTDTGGGGRGVRDIAPDDLETTALDFPLLVQKKIAGQLLDLSCFYSNSKPVFFSFAEMLRSVPNSYGPSSVRRYFTGIQDDPKLVDTLTRLGNALGADGYCNVTAIRDESNGELCFIEADLRPNVWIEHPKYFGEDPAIKLKKYFETGGIHSFDRKSGEFDEVILSWLPRLPLREIVLNRYNCRNTYENYCARHIIASRIFAPLRSLSRRLRARLG